MKITIVCAGKIKEKYLTAGIAEFMKRLKPFAQVEIREIHEEKMPDSPSEAEKEQVLAKEGEKLLKLVPESARESLIGVLAQDPRPAYQNDPERVYGMGFGTVDVKFTVTDGVLTVVGVDSAGC